MKKDNKINSICFFMAGTLFDFNLEVAKKLRSENPNIKLSAFVCGRRHLLDKIKSFDNTSNNFNRYDWLNPMISEWLATPYNPDKVNFYRKIFGDDLLRRLIVADRELGHGYVLGGAVENTRLIEACKKDKDTHWKYITGLLDYCFALLNDQKPEIVFIYAIAGADAMALKIVADHLKIPCVQLASTRVKDYYVFDASIEMKMPKIKDIYKEAKDDLNIIKDHYQEASDFINGFINNPRPPVDTQTWVKQLRRDNHPIKFIKTFTVDLIKAFAIKLGLQGSKNIYRQRKGADIITLSIRKFLAMNMLPFKQYPSADSVIGYYPYVSYFLHYEPEMTTSIMADKNMNQISVIEQISKQMPAGWKLIVKEHVPMIGRRPRGFYDRIKNIPDVVLISPFESGFNITKNADVVCTLTGTNGWESMIFGKKPIVIGHPYYISACDSVIHCPQISGLRDAIENAKNAEPVPIENLKVFIACMIKEAFEFSTDYFWFGENLSDSNFEVQLDTFIMHLKKQI